MSHWHFPAFAALASVTLLPWSIGGSPHPVVSQHQANPPLKPFVYGVRTCNDLKCHDNPLAAKDAGANIILCDYDEFRTWSTRDKHSMANTVLKGPRGRQMAELLGIKGDIATEPACISCHGVLIRDPEVKKQAEEGTFKLDEGVSCGVCHGFSYEWYPIHSAQPKRKEWRQTSRKEKQDRYGMIDLWDPETRAKLCASCHIGNAEEGKVVTHAMYAAGHPPLPGIEMASFSDAMPRHWKYLKEKSPEVQKIVKHDPAQLEHTQLVVVGGVVSFRESMSLLEAQARQGAEATDADRRWPEFAQFDCIACHHDLKPDGGRPRRASPGKVPGRPQMRSWPTALVPLAIQCVGAGNAERTKTLTAEFDEKIRRLTEAFNVKPFGDPRRISAAAGSARQWADGLLRELRTARFDETAAQGLMRNVVAESRREFHDFDSARQLGWALRAIRFELAPKRTASPAWKELGEQLQLDLPPGKVEIAKDHLQKSLDRLYQYEPAAFHKVMEQVGQELK